MRLSKDRVYEALRICHVQYGGYYDEDRPCACFQAIIAGFKTVFFEQAFSSLSCIDPTALYGAK